MNNTRLSKIATALQKTERILSLVMMIIAVVVLCVLVLLTVSDITGRTIFTQPIKGTYELTEWLVVVIVFFGLPYAASKGSDITIDLLFKRFSQRIQVVLGITTSLLVLVLAALIGWQSLILAIRLAQVGEVTKLLALPAYVPMLFIVLGAIGLCLVLVARIAISIEKVVRK